MLATGSVPGVYQFLQDCSLKQSLFSPNRLISKNVKICPVHYTVGQIKAADRVPAPLGKPTEMFRTQGWGIGRASGTGSANQPQTVFLGKQTK